MAAETETVIDGDRLMLLLRAKVDRKQAKFTRLPDTDSYDVTFRVSAEEASSLRRPLARGDT